MVAAPELEAGTGEEALMKIFLALVGAYVLLLFVMRILEAIGEREARKKP